MDVPDDAPESASRLVTGEKNERGDGCTRPGPMSQDVNVCVFRVFSVVRCLGLPLPMYTPSISLMFGDYRQPNKQHTHPNPLPHLHLPEMFRCFLFGGTIRFVVAHLRVRVPAWAVVDAIFTILIAIHTQLRWRALGAPRGGRSSPPTQLRKLQRRKSKNKVSNLKELLLL